MSKRRKSFNPRKQASSIAKFALKNLAIASVPGQGPCHIIDLKSNKIQRQIPRLTYDLFNENRYRWTVLIAVFGIDHQGQYYMKSEELVSQEEYFQLDMFQIRTEKHKSLISRFNQSQLLSVGWIATPYDKIWDEEEAFQVLEGIGALNFIKDDANQLYAA